MSRPQKELRRSAPALKKTASPAATAESHDSTLALSTLKQVAFVAAVSALHGLATQLVFVAQLGLVVAGTAR
jgi:hypothetical protein